MPKYQVPLRDMQFVLHEMLDMPAQYAELGFTEANAELIDTLIQEIGKFAEQQLVPLNAVGDRQGCRLEQGEVRTPEGFKQAYETYVAGGWPTLAHESALGGQGLPESLSFIINEVLGTANWAWAMYPGLCHGAINTLNNHGTEAQKQRYLVPLIAGRWTGTMCLTEAQCGTDLGLLKTRAEPQQDDSYRLYGSKLFISSGEHDMAENIIHIVLARLPDAPAGTRGLSLFVVPKFRVGQDGSLGARNEVSCGVLEEKMGIHGNATCLLNFDGAEGFLVGPANKGLACMFTFMNTARLGTALQGLGHAEFAFQNAWRYALERLQSRALSGVKEPDKPADPIIVHPDVRRMLLTQKAFAEGGRMLLYYAASQVDRARYSASEVERKEAELLLSLLTPVAKAFMTETGFEAASLGMQVFGGHGYIRDWGMEQNLRDSRIAMLYEGTTGIQALDLLGRKVLPSEGEPLHYFAGQVERFCQEHKSDDAMAEFIQPLAQLQQEWAALTLDIARAAMKTPDEVGAAAVDYLMYSGYCVQAYLWARAVATAQRGLQQQGADRGFYEAKIHTARFFYQKLLPRTRTLQATIHSGSKSLMAIPASDFMF